MSFRRPHLWYDVNNDQWMHGKHVLFTNFGLHRMDSNYKNRLDKASWRFQKEKEYFAKYSKASAIKKLFMKEPILISDKKEELDQLWDFICADELPFNFLR